ncbi:hypothetical protein AID11_12310 [Salmonella enterica subsp. enterica]|nr:hypothetical protein [Salmonella enterica subsp. enterica serovar Poona]
MAAAGVRITLTYLNASPALLTGLTVMTSQASQEAAMIPAALIQGVTIPALAVVVRPVVVAVVMVLAVMVMVAVILTVTGMHF